MIKTSFVYLQTLIARKFVTGILMIVLSTGCNDRPPVKMYSPANIPQNSAEIDPWIAKLLSSNVDSAKKMLDARLKSDNPALAPLVKELSDFVPCQVVYSSGVGYLRCVRRYKDRSSGQAKFEVLYVAQPLSNHALKSRLEYFEESVRPLMEAFLDRFAGSGEEMVGTAGQFTYFHWPTVSDLGARNASAGDWHDARLLHAAMNGDSVFIKQDGATAWHTLETNEMIPITSTSNCSLNSMQTFEKPMAYLIRGLSVSFKRKEQSDEVEARAFHRLVQTELARQLLRRQRPRSRGQEIPLRRVSSNIVVVGFVVAAGFRYLRYFA